MVWGLDHDARSPLMSADAGGEDGGGEGDRVARWTVTRLVGGTYVCRLRRVTVVVVRGGLRST